MSAYAVLFAGSLLVSLAVTPAIRAAARRLGVVDPPGDRRKVHRRATPLLGGVAVFIAGVAPAVALCLLGRGAAALACAAQARRLGGVLLGSAVALGAGIADDVWRLRVRHKFALQVAAASIVVGGGWGLTAVVGPAGRPVPLGLLGAVVSALWLVCCMNAVNLIDGLDGLASGVCLFASAGLFLASLVAVDPPCALVMVLTAVVGGAVLGFLVFNFHPASIFLGDGGSLSLGLVFGAASLRFVDQAQDMSLQLLPIVLLGLPLFDLGVAVARRWSRKVHVWVADREHVHHALLRSGFSHRGAVLALYGACAALTALAFLLTLRQPVVAVALLAGLGAVALAAARHVCGLRGAEVWRRLADDWARYRRAAAAALSVDEAIRRLQAASNLEEAWRAAAVAFRGLGFDRATLQLYGAGASSPRVLTWVGVPTGSAAPDPEPAVWSARLAVQDNGRTLGQLEVVKAGRCLWLLADGPRLLERVRAEMAQRIAALPSRGG